MFELQDVAAGNSSFCNITHLYLKRLIQDLVGIYILSRFYPNIILGKIFLFTVWKFKWCRWYYYYRIVTFFFWSFSYYAAVRGSLLSNQWHNKWQYVLLSGGTGGYFSMLNIIFIHSFEQQKKLYDAEVSEMYEVEEKCICQKKLSNNVFPNSQICFIICVDNCFMVKDSY